MGVLMQNRVIEPSVVGKTSRGQDNLARPLGPGQIFALQGMPDLFVEQPGGISTGDRGITQMKMIAMGIGKDMDGYLSLPRAGHRGLRKAGQRLQECERAQLQRIEFEGIGAWRHIVLQFNAYSRQCGHTSRRLPLWRRC